MTCHHLKYLFMFLINLKNIYKIFVVSFYIINLVYLKNPIILPVQFKDTLTFNMNKRVLDIPYTL